MINAHIRVSVDLCLCLSHSVLCYTSAPKSCVPLSAIGTYLSSIFTRRIVRSTWDLQLGSRWDGTQRWTTYKKQVPRNMILNVTNLKSLLYFVCTHRPFHAPFRPPVTPVWTSTASPHTFIRPNYIDSTTQVDCIIHLVWVLDLWTQCCYIITLLHQDIPYINQNHCECRTNQ
jgi:hypothetical protein